MKLLIDNKLKYGNLLTISSPHLILRYNKALELICDKVTKLKEFHIDITGYSPEIAKEFKDKSYLNPHGVNKKFILVTLEQKNLPALDSFFSSTRIMMNSFIMDNYSELFALTSKDVVYGELENSTYRIDTFEDLLSIKKVHFVINTPSNILGAASRLRDTIDEFLTSDTLWHDDDVISAMIDNVNITGDIIRNKIHPTFLDYKQNNFFTRHFGGVYVFNIGTTSTVIAVDPEVEKIASELPNVNYININDKRAICHFLIDNNIVETLTEAYLLEHLTALRNKTDFIVIDFLAERDPKLNLVDLTPDQIKSYIYENFDDLPSEFHELSKVVKSLVNGFPLSIEDIPGELFFYFVRSSNHVEKDLVNHLISFHTPHDFLTTFISNKALFYERYEEWPLSKKKYVVEYLTKNYLHDKEGVKKLIFN